MKRWDFGPNIYVGYISKLTQNIYIYYVGNSATCIEYTWVNFGHMYVRTYMEFGNPTLYICVLFYSLFIIYICDIYI